MRKITPRNWITRKTRTFLPIHHSRLSSVEIKHQTHSGTYINQSRNACMHSAFDDNKLSVNMVRTRWAYFSPCLQRPPGRPGNRVTPFTRHPKDEPPPSTLSMDATEHGGVIYTTSRRVIYTTSRRRGVGSTCPQTVNAVLQEDASHRACIVPLPTVPARLRRSLSAWAGWSIFSYWVVGF